ncbi:hypothetical protein EKH77_00025 [Streptomyces luteoverticillatus]|uniref:Uncharacterized protein n=1 Tax=Streptomyces luteoverticillatus TaxID=66425 RepID=A0A3S9PSN1_STRLT|nr:hypothetical protein EKH77_00025 [Streptomyces luteoverticillatus]
MWSSLRQHRRPRLLRWPPRRLRKQPCSSPNCSPRPWRWRDGHRPAKTKECPAAGSRQGRPRPKRHTPRLRPTPAARPVREPLPGRGASG